MSRRKFLKESVLVLGTPLVASAAPRLYGTPASVAPRDLADIQKLSLPLSRAGVAPELWDDLAKVGTLWERVLADGGESKRFHADPAAYLDALGLDGSDKTLADESVRMLRTMADPQVKQCLAAGDYRGLFQHLTTAGVFEPQSPSRLQEKITALFEANRAELQQIVDDYAAKAGQDGLLADLNRAGGTLTQDDLTAVAQVLSGKAEGAGPQPMCTSIAMCVVAVGIAATVATYVSVVVAVTVVLAVGVSITAAVQTAVTVSGGGGGGNCPPERENCFLPNVVSPPFNGTYAKLDPAMVRNLDRSIKLAALTRDGNVQIEATRALIGTEVAAVLGALRDVGLLQVQTERFGEVVDAVSTYSYKALGLPVAA